MAYYYHLILLLSEALPSRSNIFQQVTSFSLSPLSTLYGDPSTVRMHMHLYLFSEKGGLSARLCCFGPQKKTATVWFPRSSYVVQYKDPSTVLMHMDLYLFSENGGLSARLCRFAPSWRLQLYGSLVHLMLYNDPSTVRMHMHLYLFSEKKGLAARLYDVRIRFYLLDVNINE